VPRDLFILASDEKDLYEYLTRHFSGRADVSVILDRRRADRRRRSDPQRQNRRKGNRRAESTIETDLKSMGFAVVSYR
jgi:hypothetical protein